MDKLLSRLDAIDDHRLGVLGERAQVIFQVADFKQRHEVPAYSPPREAVIFERLRAINPGPVSGDAIGRIYRAVIVEMRKFEKEHVAS